MANKFKTSKRCCIALSLIDPFRDLLLNHPKFFSYSIYLLEVIICTLSKLGNSRRVAHVTVGIVQKVTKRSIRSADNFTEACFCPYLLNYSHKIDVKVTKWTFKDRSIYALGHSAALFISDG